jgi:hypothetical protein
MSVTDTRASSPVEKKTWVVLYHLSTPNNLALEQQRNNVQLIKVQRESKVVEDVGSKRGAKEQLALVEVAKEL